MTKISVPVVERFYNYIFNWDYNIYLVGGGYGSGKSEATVVKIINKCLTEKRKVLVVRDVYATIQESCFDLFLDVLGRMDMLEPAYSRKQQSRIKVIYKMSPLELKFPNGSRIIFRGLDKPIRLKSLHGCSIVWIEEGPEIKYAAYKQLRGRLRTPNTSLHFIITFNTEDMENWVYRHFFVRLDDNGKEQIIIDPKEWYKKRTLVHKKRSIYYHHSIPDDNVYLPEQYLEALIEMKEYDSDLYRVAWKGEFGTSGDKVLPQFTVATDADEFKAAVRKIPRTMRKNGMDFGFENSYNAIVKMAVDDDNKILYIYDEYYKNHMTDLEVVEDPDFQRFKDDYIKADNEDGKACKFYQQMGFKVYACKKYLRISQVRKMKRFRKIVCSPRCKNTIRECSNLTYKRDKFGNIIYDEFNIDPHTFSAMWYGLDDYNVADLKEYKNYNYEGDEW